MRRFTCRAHVATDVLNYNAGWFVVPHIHLPPGWTLVRCVTHTFAVRGGPFASDCRGWWRFGLLLRRFTARYATG